MSQENKNKKRILTYYLILGACILIIAAITVTVIFAVQNSKNSFEIDNSADNSDDNNDTDDTDDTDNTDNPDDSDDVSTSYEFIVPVAQVDVINDYTFYHNKTLDCYHFHTGLDMSGEVGTEVMACLDGTVESITVGDVLDGTVVTLSHANGVKTSYYFIDAAETLKVGDTVSRGDVIGTIAQPTGSEYKDGAHLHFEVYKDGAVVDPNEYLDIAEK